MNIATSKIGRGLILLCFLWGCENTNREELKFPIEEITIEEIHKGLRQGHFSVEELVQSYLDRIREIDQDGHQLRSVLHLNPDAIAIAQELDMELMAGKDRGPLHGVPVLLKDNLNSGDKMPTTAGSRAMEGSIASEDSFVAMRLREAGAVILGKTNLSEWANFRGELSSSGWSGLGGQTKNPYVLDRNPCGSSSGSGVAVSANLTVLAIGTETNGSIVCPSHANGIVGIKPTVGLISRSGVIPISYTQDTPGPMARTVRDAAICLGVIAGMDEKDNKTMDEDAVFHTDYTQFLNVDGLNGKRIGWYNTSEGRNFKVDTLMRQAVSFMEKAGATVVPISSIEAPGTGEHSFQVMLFEYQDGLNRYFESLGDGANIKSLSDLIAFNVKDEVSLRFHNQKYLELALKKGDLTHKDYLNALNNMIKGSREEGIDQVMKENELDAIIAPTGSPAWKTDLVNGDSFQLGSSSPAAHAGYPNITVPMGMVEALPVGISFFGKAWSEPKLLEIAYAYEQGTKHRSKPTFLPTLE
ncbi:amidase [Pleomorphovibrio marinus]|uniref:amidase n=1 Tax=Pleomorphovibrio marinus TaxID=2164132 RepID=UPI000E0A6DDA|nr:amidase [Pleomorphovibrio marinus]